MTTLARSHVLLEVSARWLESTTGFSKHLRTTSHGLRPTCRSRWRRSNSKHGLSRLNTAQPTCREAYRVDSRPAAATAPQIVSNPCIGCLAPPFAAGPNPQAFPSTNICAVTPFADRSDRE